MIADLWAMAWKEWKELLRASNTGMVIFRLAILVAVFGVMLPLQMGPGWASSLLSTVYLAWMSLYLVSAVVAGSFAGERERHTLETLLASRLSDDAILFGKILAGISYGWGLTIISMLVGLVSMNVAHNTGRIVLYSAAVGFGGVMLSFLGSGLASAAGVLVSLRASTVRQAQQTMSIAFMVTFMVPFAIIKALPGEVGVPIITALSEANPVAIVLIFGAVLLVVDVVLIGIARARFRRNRLILD